MPSLLLVLHSGYHFLALLLDLSGSISGRLFVGLKLQPRSLVIFLAVRTSYLLQMAGGFCCLIYGSRKKAMVEIVRCTVP
jgi:hypothetical protein